MTGAVRWHFEKDAAERTIRGLYGVMGISNEIVIKSQPNAMNISADIDVALHRSWFDPKTIRVTTDGGKVKLTGSVHTPGDRFTAGAAAWGSPGATIVENDLVIA